MSTRLAASCEEPDDNWLFLGTYDHRVVPLKCKRTGGLYGAGRVHHWSAVGEQAQAMRPGDAQPYRVSQRLQVLREWSPGPSVWSRARYRAAINQVCIALI